MNKAIGRPIETIADKAIKRIEKIEICIFTSNFFLPYSVFYVNKFFCHNFFKNSGISPNVPAVYDVFAAPNKGFAKQRPGLQKCGWSEPWE
jgi:hypothetical protein